MNSLLRLQLYLPPVHPTAPLSVPLPGTLLAPVPEPVSHYLPVTLPSHILAPETVPTLAPLSTVVPSDLHLPGV